VCVRVGQRPSIGLHPAVRHLRCRQTWSQPVQREWKPRPGYIADPNILVVGNALRCLPLRARHETGAVAQRNLSSVSEDEPTWGREPGFRWPAGNSGKVHVPVDPGDGTIAMATVGCPCRAGQARRRGASDVRQGGRLAIQGPWRPRGRPRRHRHHEPMGADEPALVVLRNGELFAVVRTGGPRPYEVPQCRRRTDLERARTESFVDTIRPARYCASRRAPSPRLGTATRTVSPWWLL